MALEDSFKTVMVADATLVALLTGGVFTSGTIGRDGITFEAAPTAFDANGDLKPCALVRQRDLVPDFQVEDRAAQVVSAVQAVEIYIYQESGYGTIDSALTRCYQLFQGRIFDDSFEAEWILTASRLRDDGALAGASAARQDWSIPNIVGE